MGSSHGYKSGYLIHKLRHESVNKNIDFSHFNKRISRNKIRKKCPVCKLYFFTLNNAREKETCSHSCSNTYFRTKENGKEYRHKAFKKHGYACNKCLDKRRYVLQIHHKDEDRNNNKINNLMVLCANCHLEIHFQIKNSKKKNCMKTKNPG